jgi:hypothetical protein
LIALLPVPNSGWPNTVFTLKKLPILNGTANAPESTLVLALSSVTNVSVLFSTSKPLTYPLPDDTTVTSFVLSPGIDVLVER